MQAQNEREQKRRVADDFTASLQAYAPLHLSRKTASSHATPAPRLTPFTAPSKSPSVHSGHFGYCTIFAHG